MPLRLGSSGKRRGGVMWEVLGLSLFSLLIKIEIRYAFLLCGRFLYIYIVCSVFFCVPFGANNHVYGSLEYFNALLG